MLLVILLLLLPSCALAGDLVWYQCPPMVRAAVQCWQIDWRMFAIGGIITWAHVNDSIGRQL